MSFKRLILVLVAFFLFAAASAGFGADGGSTGASPDPAQVSEMQERILGDGEIMALVMVMQSDPEVQALLADPKVLAAVQAGDFGALLNDPRVRKLLDNPRVKEIGKRLDDRSGGGEQ